ncbi:hypothetical protein HS088_TW12G01067 [Tripterygium wilfordii]|uniref:Uncharacterized protein n=1 Tax=Tripterygium wilfordii TaxID=458696 RepID=A0A7J7D1A5_TRIWF|nr:hypothetical protein HS088_TW12G01067 [Tripterygium wilfordii]
MTAGTQMLPPPLSSVKAGYYLMTNKWAFRWFCVYSFLSENTVAYYYPFLMGWAFGFFTLLSYQSQPMLTPRSIKAQNSDSTFLLPKPGVERFGSVIWLRGPIAVCHIIKK